MPTTPESATELRRRARLLRDLSRSMTSVADTIVTLIRLSGSDTWSGPRATDLLDELRRQRSCVLAESEDLIVRARTLERTADSLDAAAARTGS